MGSCSYSLTVFLVLWSFVLSSCALFIDSWSWDKPENFPETLGRTYGLLARYDEKGRMYNGRTWNTDFDCPEEDSYCEDRKFHGKICFGLCLSSAVVSFVCLFVCWLVSKHKIHSLRWFWLFGGLSFVGFTQLASYMTWTEYEDPTLITGASPKVALFNFAGIVALLGFSSHSALMSKEHIK
jgi:hypothetical protein